MAFIALTLSVSLSAQGIEFFHGTWAEAKTKAAKEKKPIFIDAFTTWCGPCKMMARDIFTQQEVGEFYNKNFVCVKMDMEQPDGMLVADENNVRAYPTYLFFDQNGNATHRGVGYIEAEQFIQVGKDALVPDKQFMTLQKRYEKGDRNPDFLYNYAYACKSVMDGQEEFFANEYLTAQPDWSKPAARKIIAEIITDGKSKAFAYLLAHRAEFDKEFGKEAMDERISSVAIQLAMEATQANGGEIPEAAVKEIFKTYMPSTAETTFNLFKMQYAISTENWALFGPSAVAYVEGSPNMNAADLNTMAWAFYQYVDDKTLLKKALAWAKLSVKKEASYANADTLAQLYGKLGDKKNAKKAAKEAIKLAKAEGVEDYSETENLLK